MIGIVLATMDEAGRLIERLGACKVADEPFQTYTFATARGRSGGVIVISGMGKVHSAEAAKHLIANHQVTEILHLVRWCGSPRSLTATGYSPTSTSSRCHAPRLRRTRFARAGWPAWTIRSSRTTAAQS